MSARSGRSAGAVAYFVRAGIRRDWRSVLLLAGGIALAGGMVMTAANGAVRAAGAWEQFLTRTEMADVATSAPVASSRQVAADLAARPGITSVVRLTYVPFGPEGTQSSGFVGSGAEFGSRVMRPIIVKGRAADPNRADEFTINQSMAELTGLGPGDKVTVVELTAATPQASVVRQSATIVGIHISVLDAGLNASSPMAIYTPAFGAKWQDRFISSLNPDSVAGYSDLVLANTASGAVTRGLLAEGFVSGRQVAGTQTSAGLTAERTGYALLAIVAAIGSAFVIGQFISRSVGRRSNEAPTLAALGLEPRGRRLALAGSSIGSVLMGVTLAPVVAYFASPLVSRGLVGVLDPHGHRVISMWVLVIGPASAAFVLLLVAVGSALRADRAVRTDVVRPTSPSRVSVPNAAGLFGLRVASGWGRRSGRVIARSHVAMVTLGVAGVVAVALWTTTAGHLVSVPAAYGATWDAQVVLDDTGHATVKPLVALDGARSAVGSHPETGVVFARALAGTVAVGDQSVEVVLIDRASGSFWPDIVAGRAPRGDDEITIGSGIVDKQHSIGSQVDIAGRRFTIVGCHVLPVFSNSDFGQNIAVRMSALPNLEIAEPSAVLLVKLSRGRSPADLQTVVGPSFVVRTPEESKPGSVLNLGHVLGLYQLLLVVCVVLAVSSLANGVVLTTHARRRDHGVLRALGASRVTVVGSVAWHTATVVVTAAALGAVSGVIAGLAVWHNTSRSVSVGPDLFSPVLIVCAVVAGVGLAGTGTALVGGAGAWRRSRRQPRGE